MYNGNTIGSGNYNLHILFAQVSMLRVDAQTNPSQPKISIIRS